MTSNTFSYYEWIKEKAKEYKRSIEDLIVLTPQNDPYYVGSHTQKRHASWIADIVKQYLRERGKERVHDRAIHYYILSKGLDRPFKKNSWKTYEGDRNDFAFAMKAIQNARLLGLLPWEVIEDKKNPDPIIMAHYWNHMNHEEHILSPEKLAQCYVNDFISLNPQLQQAFHLELWPEKTTINDILYPIATKYGVNIQPFSGQATATRVYELILRISEISKPVRILYISDFDKFGHNMPVATGRKIQWFMDNYKITSKDVKLEKILLTESQVDEYDLPSAPGEESKVELDALEVYYPGESGKIVEAAVQQYIDLEIFEQIEKRNSELKEILYSRLVEQLNLIKDQLESITLPQVDVEQLPKAVEINDGDEHLYDSRRRYFEQTFHFKDFLKSR